MASQNGEVNLSYEELQAQYLEQALLVEALEERVQAAEDERDRSTRGIEFLTQALRRRGCCDHAARNGGPL